MGLFLDWYGYKRRLVLENKMYTEEINQRDEMARRFRLAKMGREIDNDFTVNYLVTEHDY